MVRKAKKYSVEEVLQHVRIPNNDSDVERRDFDGDLIKISSLRLATFKYKGCKCIKCGTEGTYFFKEKHNRKGKIYHFNLYGINAEGIEVLMTKDHIIPKSKGGKNYIDNMQTMCQYCNCEKGNKVKGEEDDKESV